MKKGRLLIVFLLVAVLATAAFAATNSATSLSTLITNVLDGFFSVVNYLFGFKFLPGIAQQAKVDLVVRLSIFMLAFVLALEGAKHLPVFKLSDRASRTIGLAFALLCSFTISTNTLRAIGGVYGLTFAFLIMLVPALGLLAIIFLIPSNRRSYLGVKILLLLLVLWLTTVQGDLLGGTATGSVIAVDSVSPITGHAVGPTLYFDPTTNQYYEGGAG